MAESGLGELVKILTSGVQTLEYVYTKNGCRYPDLSEPFVPSSLDKDREANAAVAVIVAAAAQIIASVRSPFASVVEYSTGSYAAAAMNIVNELLIPNILQDAGDEGAHVDDISQKTGVAPDRLARILRYLATRHIFREIKPNVFANNRVSSVLIRPHAILEMKEHPDIAYDGASAASYVDHCTYECFKGAQALPAWIKDGPNGFATPFNQAFNTSVTFFDWLNLPENSLRNRRFASAMSGMTENFPMHILVDGFDWKSLRPDDVVVDVGGSAGTVTYAILNENPNLRYIVQDQESVINSGAKPYWEKNCPSALADGRVRLQASNFLETQPVKNAAVYVMRFVLHDWPDEQCRRILRILRDAAGSSSRLVVFDQVVKYPCRYDGPFADASTVEGAPAPLLANLGVGASGFLTMVDLQMLNLVNGKERTVLEFIELGNATGWKIESIKPAALSAVVFSAA